MTQIVCAECLAEVAEPSTAGRRQFVTLHEGTALCHDHLRRLRDAEGDE